MFADAIWQAACALAVLGGTAMLIVWLGRGATNQRVVHSVAIVTVLFLVVVLAALNTAPLPLAFFASAYVAFLLQWTYRRAERLPPSGFARLYAVGAGLLVVLASAFAGGWYWEVAERNVTRQRESRPTGIVDPIDSKQRRRLSEVSEKNTDWSQLRPIVDEPVVGNAADEARKGRIRWLDEKPKPGDVSPSRESIASNRFEKYRSGVDSGAAHTSSSNVFDQFDAPQASTNLNEPTLDTNDYSERDPWLGAGAVGAFLWLLCLVRFLVLWIWRGFRLP